MNAMWPERFSSVRRDQAARRGPQRVRRGALGAVRAALSVHERVKAQRAHLRRLEAATDAPVTPLPFVFESELGLAALRAPRRRAVRLMEAPSRRLAPSARCVWAFEQLVLWVALLIAGVALLADRRARPVAAGRRAGRARCCACRWCRCCAGRAGAGTCARRASTSATARSPCARRSSRGCACSTSRRVVASSSRSIEPRDGGRAHRRRLAHDPAAGAARRRGAP